MEPVDQLSPYAFEKFKKLDAMNHTKDIKIIVTAPGAPVPVIPKSIASPSLIADIITKKYVDATPFYRQEQNNKRYGVPVT